MSGDIDREKRKEIANAIKKSKKIFIKAMALAGKIIKDNAK